MDFLPLTISLPDIAATENLARRLVPLLRSRDVITLRGELGTGKTTFARALLRRMGVDEEIPSPTFTLVQNYEGKDFPIYHFDLYRLKNSAEMEELGFEDACAHGFVLVEWPERALEWMPRDRLELKFDISEQGDRQVNIVPYASWQQRLKGFSA